MARVELRDGLGVHVHDAGRGDALLLLHGFTGCARAWPEHAVSALASKRRVLCVDLLGHGRSDRCKNPERYALDEMVLDLCEVLDACAVKRASWTGYSMGARIALGAALRAPERVSGLVLEGGSPGLFEPTERAARLHVDEALARDLETHGLPAFVERWMAQPLFASQRRLGAAVVARERARRLDNDAASLAACLRGLGSGAQPSLWKELWRVRAPTLLLVGEEDAVFRALAGRMAAALPDARLETVPHAGHATHLENPEAWTAAVLGAPTRGV